MTLPKHLHGIAYMILAMALFSLMNSCLRFSSAEMPSAQMVLLRNAFAVVMLFCWSFPRHGRIIFTTQRWRGHGTRALIGIVSMEIWFYTIGVMPLNEATALSFTAPIFATMLAILLLKEKATPARWTAILVGFAGMLVILRPGAALYTLPALLVLCSAMMMAFGGTLIKTLTKAEHPDKIVFLQALVMTPLAIPAALYHWQALSLQGIGWAVLVAFFSLTAHLSLTRAFALSEMVLLMPFEFVRLLLTALLAWAWFGETLDGYTALGALLIVAGSVWSAAEGNPTVKRLLRRLMMKKEN
jgi:drug/metabolite transporter (DMT)-like permease